jgi:hypothetical protein
VLANVDPGTVGSGGEALNAAIPGGTRTVDTMEDYLNNNATHNVKDYGALCDDSTDDSVALQRAIDAAEDDTDPVNFLGANVFMPPGICKFSAGLVFARNGFANLIGAGAKQVRLEYTGGAGTAITLTGTTSGDNAQWTFKGFQLVNTGSGTTGIDADFMGFSPYCEQVIVDGFAGPQYDLTNFENGIFNGCRAELGSVGTYGFKITNGNDVRGTAQVHGEGAFDGSSGSVAFYMTSADVVDLNLVLEGGGTGASPVNSDICLWIDGDPDPGTGGHGGGQITVYGERCTLGALFDNTLAGSSRDPHNITLEGKISGNITTAIKIDDADHISVGSMTLQTIDDAGATCILATSNATDIDIDPGITYLNCGTSGTKVGDTSSFPTEHDNSWDYSQPGGGNLLVELDDQASNVAATNVDVLSMGHSDPRRPIAVNLMIEITVDTVCTNENFFLTLKPGTGAGAVNTYETWVHRAALDAGDQVWDNIVLPVHSSGTIAYALTNGDWTGCQVDVDIRQLGVMY